MTITQTVEQHIAEHRTPERDKMLEEATAFFLKHAGMSWHPDYETPEQGAARSARLYAEAELYGMDHSWETDWSDDWDGDHSYTDEEIGSCELVTLYDEDGNDLAGLGCVDDATDDYRRVVAAELAMEAAPWMHDPRNPEHYYDPNRDRAIATCGECGVQWCTVCHPSPSDRCHQEAEHPEPDDDDEGRSYLIGLPVIVTVYDDGRVSYEVCTAEAGTEIFALEDVTYDEDTIEADVERVETDHHGRMTERGDQ